MMQLVLDDPTLASYHSSIKARYERYLQLKDQLARSEGSFQDFAKGYERFGLHRTSAGLMFKEWAPGALAMCIYGDFNEWKRWQFNGTKDEYGIWTILLPRTLDRLPSHNEKYKLILRLGNGKEVDRIPAWASYVQQNISSRLFDCVFWDPVSPYEWKYEAPKSPTGLKIYECHIGMCSEYPVVASYTDFRTNVLPRIAETGYNAIQLMAIMEHAYYASFGYHVTNFFAASSRYGTPDDLKALVDEAHRLGLVVLMDLVHSHASSNVLDGINQFDGTDHQYFHEGVKGKHKLWDSRLFNYDHWEVLRFLLSNVAWWMKEYRFDGFRFDGVTSMLYVHHGIGVAFSGKYHEYFHHCDDAAVTYLMLANDLIHEINPNAISVAEEVSGMPGTCRPLSEGGLGFDYRLNMSVPDLWIKLLKEVKDDAWPIGGIVWALINRRYNEKHICYSESHDQSIVGDKTIAMWLFDSEIYHNMSVNTPLTDKVSRGMALHKMIKMITHALGGEGFLTFMGNEFGHPEWVDFPRAGNQYSHHYSRRQWHLRDDVNLRYHNLWQFDKALQLAEQKYHWLSSHDTYVTVTDQTQKVIVFERGGLLWVFNFHPTNSYTDYKIGTRWPFEHIVVLDTDETLFQGQNRYDFGHSHPCPIMKTAWQNRPNHIQLYIPCRTAVLLKPLIGTDERQEFGLPVEIQPTEEALREPGRSLAMNALLREELPEETTEEVKEETSS